MTIVLKKIVSNSYQDPEYWSKLEAWLSDPNSGDVQLIEHDKTEDPVWREIVQDLKCILCPDNETADQTSVLNLLSRSGGIDADWWGTVEKTLRDFDISDLEGVRILGRYVQSLIEEKPELLEDHKLTRQEQVRTRSSYYKIMSIWASYDTPMHLMRGLCLLNGVSEEVLLEKFNQLSPLMTNSAERRDSLKCACQMGTAKLVRGLLEGGFYINNQNQGAYGLPVNDPGDITSPAFYAVLAERTDTVKVLLEHGVNLEFPFSRDNVTSSTLANAFYYPESSEIARLMVEDCEKKDPMTVSVSGYDNDMTLAGYLVDRLITNEERLGRDTPAADLQLLKKIVSWAPSVFLDRYGEASYVRESPLAHIFEKGSKVLTQFCLDEIVFDEELDWAADYASSGFLKQNIKRSEVDGYIGPDSLVLTGDNCDQDVRLIKSSDGGSYRTAVEGRDGLPRVDILEKILLRKDSKSLAKLLPHIKSLGKEVFGGMSALEIATKIMWDEGVGLIRSELEKRVLEDSNHKVDITQLGSELEKIIDYFNTLTEPIDEDIEEINTEDSKQKTSITTTKEGFKIIGDALLEMQSWCKSDSH